MWRLFSPFLNASDNTGAFARYHPMIATRAAIGRLGPPTAMLGRALWWAPRSNMFLAACTGAETFFAGSERRR